MFKMHDWVWLRRIDRVSWFEHFREGLDLEIEREMEIFEARRFV